MSVKTNVFSSKQINLNSHLQTGGFCRGLHVLTHWGRVTHMCVGNPTIIGSDNGLAPGQGLAPGVAPSHYLNQCWNVYWTLRNKHKWKFKRNSCILIQWNTFENVVCEMAATLCRRQCAKPYCQGFPNAHPVLPMWYGVTDPTGRYVFSDIRSLMRPSGWTRWLGNDGHMVGKEGKSLYTASGS